MRIGLIDVDGHHFPNIPLMKLSAWHKSQGDSVEWHVPLLSGHLDKACMSKVFSFTPDYPYPVDADEIVRGGSGYCISKQNVREVYDGSKDIPLPDEIDHAFPDYSLYPEFCENTAYGFLTRGCPRGCGFCRVGAKEGRASRKAAGLSEFWDGKKKNIVLCDPNVLACPDCPELLGQLAESGAWLDFNQGLDIRLLDGSALELLMKIKLKGARLSWDRYEDGGDVLPKLEAFKKATGFGQHEVVVYVLCNYDTTLEQDLERIQKCRELDFRPFPMIYDKEHADPVYKKLQRWCNPHVFWKVPRFKDYKR